MILVIVAIVVVVLLAVVGGVALGRRRARVAAVRREQEEGANEFLQSPPTSFPTDKPAPGRTPAHAAIDPGSIGALPAAPNPAPHVPEHAAPEDLEAAKKQLTASAAAAKADDEPATKAEGGVEGSTAADPESTPSDDGADPRFRSPGYLAAAQPAPSIPDWSPTGPTPPVSEADAAPIAAEPEPEVAAAAQAKSESTATPEPDAEAESVAQVESESKAEPEPASVAAGVEDTTVGSTTLKLVDDDELVIDLAGEAPADDDVDQERAWRDVALEPEPDVVDHVLQALINRARFKQVGVEEVATELVERADLRSEEVADVLAELVGRADPQILDSGRSSELVLFNDEVPSRPGQLTDFARLAPVDKKRIIIRVLCLLVARSEDQQLPPRLNGDDPTTSWPLARAVWPMAGSDEDGEPVLPNRLAKSG